MGQNVSDILLCEFNWLIFHRLHGEGLFSLQYIYRWTDELLLFTFAVWPILLDPFILGVDLESALGHQDRCECNCK